MMLEEGSSDRKQEKPMWGWNVIKSESFEFLQTY
jgi:hypothetical protein